MGSNTKPGTVTRVKFITRHMVETQPHKIFVFGDNMERRGYGGQAASMRGCINAIGIPTKWAPGMADEDFFNDDDLSNPLVCHRIIMAVSEINSLRLAGWDVVLPTDGLGTGLSELPKRAPLIFDFINDALCKLAASNG